MSLRPHFKRSIETFTVLRPIRVNRDGKVIRLEAGETFNKSEVKNFVLLDMYRKRRVGPEGHAWTLAALERRYGLERKANDGQTIAEVLSEAVDDEVTEVAGEPAAEEEEEVVVTEEKKPKRKGK